MKPLLIIVLLLISTLSFSQFYERIGYSRQEIYSEFTTYKSVVKIKDNNALYVCTDKTEIFYIFDEYTDICQKVYVVPFDKKTSLEFLNTYKKKYKLTDYNEFQYFNNNGNIKMLFLFNSQDELFFTFKEKTIDIN